MSDTSDETKLRNIIEQHVAETNSERGKLILTNWDYYKTCFKKIIPNDYLKIKTEIAAQEKTGLAYDEAVLAAFKKCS